jgi:NMD protein affecting ribosome stability and mRNA decay
MIAMAAPFCRECGKRLKAPKTLRRNLCRSCWRVTKILKT